MHEVESEAWKRKRGQVTPYRGARPWIRRQRRARRDGAYASERKNTARAIDEVVVDLDERSGGSPTEYYRPKRRDRRVNIASR